VGRPRFEVADVVRAHADDYRRRHHPSAAQERVLERIATCRTVALGGHLDECDDCGHQRISYNSCRDRHCPKCQNTQRAQWLTERLERLLPVPYFHVVFTIPDQLNPLALRNRKRLFDILFATASRALLTIAQDPKHLGAQIGFTAVLHTWGQNLLFHPHLHCVVTGGGLSPDGTHWLAARPDYLVSVMVLGRLFRGLFLDALDQAYRRGELDLAGSTAELAHPLAWQSFKKELYAKNWVVYAKPPFGGPEQVFRYLGRYTHRVAISNHRIVAFADGKVTFLVKDYKQGGKQRRMTLTAVEFLRRFLLHVLPKGFVRIRHYGLCAPRNLHKLETARHLLMAQEPTAPGAPVPPATPQAMPWHERFLAQTGIDVMACPCCQRGRMVRRRRLSPAEAATLTQRLPEPFPDTS